MKYITVKEASEKWNISMRRVCILCRNGRIHGAVKKSKVWMIPVDAQKPQDARSGEYYNELNPLVLLLNPDYGKEKGNISLTKKENSVCEIQRKFFSGQLEEAYFGVSVLLDVEKDDRFAFLLMLLKMYFAADLGKKEEYLNTLNEISLIKEKLKNEHLEFDLFSFYSGEVDVIDSELFSGELFNEFMPLICLLSVRRGLNEMIQNGANANISHFEIICKELENNDCPLISAYYHIFIAVYMNALNNNSSYKYHIERAADILLPRGWYVPLAEYSSTIDLSFIKNIDAKAYNSIILLSKKIVGNFVRVGIFDPLSVGPRLDMETNIKIGVKIVQGKNNEEIAREMGISLYKVRQHIHDLYDIVGTNSKNDIKKFVLKNFIL